LTPQFSAFVAPALALALNLGGRDTIKIVPVAVPPIKVIWPGATTTTTTTTTVPSGESALNRSQR
jgi:hypothetical protein